ncbi:MAG TPA: flagellar assembly protein FliW [Treponemataceae bacterium]|nr:flagellar assembly protein FliW [Treponemataceae bacterium]
MDIQTKSMGKVNVDNKPQIKIAEGLFGFEKKTGFVLLESDYTPFLWLQSICDKTLAFLVVDPFVLFADYEIEVDDKTVADLNIDKPSDVMILVIITIPMAQKPITANLQGPIVINKKNNKAKQIILDNPQWTTKQSLRDAIDKRGEKC